WFKSLRARDFFPDRAPATTRSDSRRREAVRQVAVRRKDRCARTNQRRSVGGLSTDSLTSACRRRRHGRSSAAAAEAARCWRLQTGRFSDRIWACNSMSSAKSSTLKRSQPVQASKYGRFFERRTDVVGGGS